MRTDLWWGRAPILILVTLVGAYCDNAPPKAAPEPATAPRSAATLDQPRAGSPIVSGHSQEVLWPVRIKVFDGRGRLIQQRDVLVDASDSSLVAGFPGTLQVGQIVQAYYLAQGAEVVPSSPVAVTAAETTRLAENAPGLRSSVVHEAAPITSLCDNGTIDETLGRPSIQGARSGSTQLMGNAVLKAGNIAVCINGMRASIADVSTPTSFGQSIAFTGGAYDVRLPDSLGLKTNQDVLVVITSADGNQRLTNRASVALGAPTGVKARIRGVLAPGQTSVYVNATPTPANSGYEVRLYPCVDGAPATVKLATSVKPYAVADAAGQASVTFDQPLSAGQSVSFCQTIVDTSDPNAAPISVAKSDAVAVTDPQDIGRIRYYFTSGVVLSNDHGFQVPVAGTQAGLFLGLNADRSWIPLNADGYRRWNVNTYFDARLTSVPTQLATATVTSTLASFSQSQKAASLQAGLYFPLLLAPPWDRGNDKYSLFFAPLVKVGFTTLTDEQTVTSNPTTAATPGTVTTLPVTDRFFKSYSYGTRLGVFQHFRSMSTAPDLVSYVDITVGRFGDFEAFRDLIHENPNALPSEADEFLRVRPWRYSFEGVIKMPHSPFVVGFNANIGMGAFPPTKDANGMLRPYSQPRDDLRFLIGAQFDFSKLLKTIPQF